MELPLIQNKIYEMRGQKVMLDFDLAALYEVETRVLNQAVKRNRIRFPEDFMFRLTKEEWNVISSSQIVMMEYLPKNRTERYLPYAFTEHGVTMLASVLRSEKAVAVNIAIVRAFIALREWTLNYKELALKITELEEKYDMQLLDIYTALNSLIEDNKQTVAWNERQKIGFKK